MTTVPSDPQSEFVDVIGRNTQQGRDDHRGSGASLSLSLSLSLCNREADAAVDPLKQIRSRPLYVQLDDDQAATPTRGVKLEAPSSNRVQLAFYSSREYTGTVSRETVARLVGAGKAETLQCRLSPTEGIALEGRLRELDIAMRELSIAIAAQEDDIKERLRNDPERAIVLRADPPVTDPRYPEVERLNRSMKYDVGTVWGEPHPDGHVHLIVRWTDWPGLKALYDDRFAIMKDRRDRIRSWISDRFATAGMEIFEK